MTFLQPKKDKNFLIRLMIISITPFILSVIFLVVMYNQVVTFEHEILKADKAIEESQILSAELKEKIFSFFSSDSVEKIMAEKGLIQDKNPEYFENLSSSRETIAASLR